MISYLVMFGTFAVLVMLYMDRRRKRRGQDD